MKIKSKSTVRPHKPPKPLPRLLRDIFGQLDAAGDSPILLMKDDITSDIRPYIPILTDQGLLSEEPANAIACISCNAMATIRRKGAKGETASALCPCCGAIFQTNNKELWRWRADWNSLSQWVKNLSQTVGEAEAVSPQAFFLGHFTKGQDRFEIYLARSLSEPVFAKQAYSAISQSMVGSGIVLSLAGHFTKPANSKIVTVSLADCLVVSETGIGFTWPAFIFFGKDQAKQSAGLARAQKDPRTIQKENLKGFVRKNITGIFAHKYHRVIAVEIMAGHADQISYKDRNGDTLQLSEDMVRTAIKEVMKENGLEDWISGIKFKS